MREYIDKETLLNELITNKLKFIGSPDEVTIHDEKCDYAIDIVNSQKVYQFNDILR